MLHCSYENRQQFLRLYEIPNSKEVVPYWNLNILEMIYLKESLRWVTVIYYDSTEHGALSPLQSIIIRWIYRSDAEFCIYFSLNSKTAIVHGKRCDERGRGAQSGKKMKWKICIKIIKQRGGKTHNLLEPISIFHSICKNC